MKIAYGRIAQETNAYSPVESTMEDFERMHLLEGRELARAVSPLRQEVKGLARSAELSGFARAARAAGVEAVPTLSAWAIPSGPLVERAYDELCERLVRALHHAGKVDGLYLALHGAMRAHGRERDPEAGFLRAAREVVGPEVPIAVSFDLHGLLTPAKLAPADLVTAYRTNPHRDLPRTGERTGELLIRLCKKEIRPTSTWRALPMVLGGGVTIDVLAPMRSLFARMTEMEQDPRVLYVSLYTCHIWNDSPDLGWSVHVITDDDPRLADRLADELADRAWAVRHEQPPRFLSPEEAIARAKENTLLRRAGAVCFCDTSDVVFAGATGENTNLVAKLIEHAAPLLCYAPIRDAAAVEAAWGRAIGEAVELTLGGRLDPLSNPPLAVRGRLRAKVDTGYSGRALVLEIEHLRLVVTERAPLTLKPSFYRDLGLEPWKADVMVVKSFFHWRFFFLAVNRKSYPVVTRGVTDFDCFRRVELSDPVHPKDAVEDWRPADRRRRGLEPRV